MATNTTNNIARTSNAETGNSEIEIYLNKRYLIDTHLEYFALKAKLIQWANKMQLGMTNLKLSSSGTASRAFWNKYTDYDLENYNQLFDRLCVSIDIMSDAIERTKKLLAQCENFYEIVIGGAVCYTPDALSTPTSLTDILFLNAAKYYDNGVLKDTTDSAVECFKSIGNNVNSLEEILNSLEVKKLNISSEADNINTDVKSNEILVNLMEAFDHYVSDVRKFNSEIAKDFGMITDSSMLYDHTRTYEYPNVKDEKDIVRLIEILKNELHEMGVSDEFINKAMEMGFSLGEITAAVEAVKMEEKALHTEGKEIELLNCAIMGDVKKTVECIDGLSEFWHPEEVRTPICACYASMFLIKSLNNGFEGGVRFADEESTENFRNGLNYIINDQRALEFYKTGTYSAALISYYKYGGAMLVYDKAEIKPLAEEFNKSLLTYDLFAFLDNEVDTVNDNNFEKMGIGDKHFEIGELEYTDNGYALTNISNGKKTYNMYVTYEDTLFGVNEAHANSADTAAIDAAVKKHEELSYKVAKDVIVGGITIFNPAAGATAKEVFDVCDSVVKSDVKGVTSMVDKKIMKVVDSDGNWESETGYSKGVLSAQKNLQSDAYDLAKSKDAEDAAKKTATDNQYAQLFGSVGKCTITEGETEVKTYAVHHDGMRSTKHDNAMSMLATEGQGLKAICNFDEKSIEKLDEKYQNDPDYEVKMQIINGGYQYSSDDNLYGKMKEIERDYDDIHPGEDKQLVFRSWDNVG